jgi:outer membrane biosynthesis protein TonB
MSRPFTNRNRRHRLLGVQHGPQGPTGGKVKLGILILPNGKVDRQSSKVLTTAGKDPDEAAIAAIVQWKFKPPASVVRQADCRL